MFSLLRTMTVQYFYLQIDEIGEEGTDGVVKDFSNVPDIPHSILMETL